MLLDHDHDLQPSIAGPPGDRLPALLDLIADIAASRPGVIRLGPPSVPPSAAWRAAIAAARCLARSVVVDGIETEGQRTVAALFGADATEGPMLG